MPAGVLSSVDAAGERRAAAARQRWIARAGGELEAYLRDHVEFFSDDFWDHLHGQRSTRRLGSPPGDRRLLGAVVRAAERDGLIAKTGEYRLSRPSSAGHAAPKPVWRSLVFVPSSARTGAADAAAAASTLAQGVRAVR